MLVRLVTDLFSYLIGFCEMGERKPILKGF